MPTRALFGGLLAIQKTTDRLRTPVQDYWDIYMEELDGDIVLEKNVHHTFADLRNFGFDRGEVVLRDFGGIGVPEFLTEYRQDVRRLLMRMTESEMSLRGGSSLLET